MEDHGVGRALGASARPAPRRRRRGCGSSAACRCAWRGRCARRTRRAGSAGSAQPSSLPGQYMSMPVSPTATTRGCRGQPLDDGLGLVGERVGAGGVQRDGRVDPWVGVGGIGDPARGLRDRRRWSRRPARRRPRPGRRSRGCSRRRWHRRHRGGCARRSAARAAPGPEASPVWLGACHSPPHHKLTPNEPPVFPRREDAHPRGPLLHHYGHRLSQRRPAHRACLRVHRHGRDSAVQAPGRL